MSDLATAVCLVGGGVFAFVAALGLLRMPDVFIRMHAATKAGTLGVGLIMAAVAIHFGEAGVLIRAVAGIAFLIITAPVAAHLIGRAAYREGVAMWEGTVIDEWGRPSDRAGQPPAEGVVQVPVRSGTGNEEASETGRKQP